MRPSGQQDILLMIETLHDLIYENLRNSGSMAYIGSCRFYIISTYDRSGLFDSKIEACRLRQLPNKERLSLLLATCTLPPENQ